MSERKAKYGLSDEVLAIIEEQVSLAWGLGELNAHEPGNAGEIRHRDVEYCMERFYEGKKLLPPVLAKAVTVNIHMPGIADNAIRQAALAEEQKLLERMKVKSDE